jgi:predicted GTPase
MIVLWFTNTNLCCQDPLAEYLLESPWREQTRPFSEENADHFVMEAKQYRPINNVKVTNVLLLGLAGAGKSSFVGTINAGFTNMISLPAIAGDMGSGVTKQLRFYDHEYKDVDDSVKQTYFRFMDTMGLELETSSGSLNAEDIPLLMNGHIMDQYKFNPSRQIDENDAHFRKNPKIEHQAHVLAIVIDAERGTAMSHETKSIISKAVATANELGIRTVSLLTKVDKTCLAVEQDLTNVFQSREVHNMVASISSMFGVRKAEIMPIKNFDHENRVEWKVKQLAFEALKKILDLADDTVREITKKASVDARNHCEHKEWKKITNEDMEAIKAEVKQYEPPHFIECVNIVVTGPRQNGSSSFINTVNSSLSGKITKKANVSKSVKPVTTKLTHYTLVRTTDNKPCLKLWDSMGLKRENENLMGIGAADLAHVLEGHLPNNYQFNPTSLADPDKKCIEEWTLSKRPHGLIFVVNATELEGLPDAVVSEIHKVQELAMKATPSIYYCLVLTHLDLACPNLAQDCCITNIYSCPRMKELTKMAEDKLRFQPGDIFLVKNYFDETQVTDQVDLITLSTMRSVLSYVGDKLEQAED